MKLDSRSGWAEEARNHVEALDRVAQTTANGVERQFVDQAARGTDSHLLDEAVRRFPQIARDWAESELLNTWPKAFLEGRGAQAADSLAASRRVGDALARVIGDGFLRDAVSAIDKSRGPATRSLARAHRTFGEGMERYEELALPEATRLFEATRAPLEKARSPFALWTQLQLAVGAFFDADLPGASARLEPVVPAVRRAGYARLVGLTLRMRGLLHGVQGAFPEQLREYRQALESFERARDNDNVAAMHASLAENMDHLGEPQLGWLHLSLALSGLANVRSLRRRLNMLLVSANACLQQGLPQVALAFQAAALDTAREWNRPVAIAEAYLHRAEAYHRLKMQEQAVHDLAEANAWLDRAGPSTLEQRYRARVQLATGEVQHQAQPDASAAALTRALGTPNGPG